MLDTETKRRIDTARDILVGKVPDPKSQVDQITIALIYKFMDDIDAESEEFEGNRKFFANEFSCYGWAKLMRSGLGGHETLNLYAEAIVKTVEAGFGVAFVSQLAAQCELLKKGVVEVPVEGFDLQRKIFMLRKKYPHPNRAVEAFWGFIHDPGNADLLRMADGSLED